MVGRPWGQFHGLSIVPMFLTTRTICVWVKDLPIIMLDRHARIANILRTLLGRGIWVCMADPRLSVAGISDSRTMSSSRSRTPNTTSLLSGKEISLQRWPIGSLPLSSTSTTNPFFSSAARFSMTISSSTAVRSSRLG